MMLNILWFRLCILRIRLVLAFIHDLNGPFHVHMKFWFSCFIVIDWALALALFVLKTRAYCFFLFLLFISIPNKTCIYTNTLHSHTLTHIDIHIKTHAIACVCVRLYEWKQRHFFLLIGFNSMNCPLHPYPSIDRNEKNSALAYVYIYGCVFIAYRYLLKHFELRRFVCVTM